MNPADLDGLAEDDKNKLLGMIENMQTRDRCGTNCFRRPHFHWHAIDASRTSPAALTSLPQCSLRMYNGLVERCFIQCVDSFRRKTLEKNEEQARHSAVPLRARKCGSYDRMRLLTSRLACPPVARRLLYIHLSDVCVKTEDCSVCPPCVMSEIT